MAKRLKRLASAKAYQTQFSRRQPAGAYNLQLGTNDAERIKLTGLKVKSGGLAADSLYYLWG